MYINGEAGLYAGLYELCPAVLVHPERWLQATPSRKTTLCYGCIASCKVWDKIRATTHCPCAFPHSDIEVCQKQIALKTQLRLSLLAKLHLAHGRGAQAGPTCAFNYLVALQSGNRFTYTPLHICTLICSHVNFWVVDGTRHPRVPAQASLLTRWVLIL